MKKQLILSLVCFIALAGCGNGSSSSTAENSSENNYTLGNSIIKMVSSVNAAVMVNFKREKFSFTKYPDLKAYVDNLKKSTVCSSGDINITVVNQDSNKCGTYKIVAHNCYFNGDSLLFDGNATIDTVNIDNLGCYKTDVNYTSNVKFDRYVLGQKETVEFNKGFIIKYSPNNINSYNILGNGILDVNGSKYLVDNFNIYIDGTSFVFNRGNLTQPDTNLSIRFTEFSSQTYLKPITYEVENNSWFMFIYNGDYYSLYNDSNASTVVLDPHNNQISDKYNFYNVYQLYHN